MRHLRVSAALAVMAVIIGACGNTDPNETNSNMDQADVQPADDQENDVTNNADGSTGVNETEAEDQNDMQAKMDALDFYEIEVEASYSKGQEFEAEIEQDDDEPIRAEVEDELNNEMLTGKQAFNSIYPKAEKLDLHEDRSDQEAIDQVLNAFDLADDYEEFEVELTFHDGSELEVEDNT